MIPTNPPKIQLDIDRDRLREIVEEALRMIYEYVEGGFIYTKEEVLKELELFLESGQISTQFFLRIGSKKIPDMQLRVDPRRRKVLGISKFKKKIAQINYFLRIL